MSGRGVEVRRQELFEQGLSLERGHQAHGLRLGPQVADAHLAMRDHQLGGSGPTPDGRQPLHWHDRGGGGAGGLVEDAQDGADAADGRSETYELRATRAIKTGDTELPRTGTETRGAVAPWGALPSGLASSARPPRFHPAPSEGAIVCAKYIAIPS